MHADRNKHRNAYMDKAIETNNQNISLHKLVHVLIYLIWHMACPQWKKDNLTCVEIYRVNFQTDHLRFEPDKPGNQILMGHQTPNPALKIPQAVGNSGQKVAIYKTKSAPCQKQQTIIHRNHTERKQFSGCHYGQ